MALEHLLAALERETGERIAAVRQEAEGRAAAIREEAEAAVAHQLEGFERRHRAALEDEAGAEVAQARERAARRRLDARSALLHRVFTRAGELLEEAASTSAGRAALIDQARSAGTYVGGTPATLRCAPALAGALTAAFPPASSVRIVADAQAPPGFTLATDDNHLTVDGTLAARLERLRPALAVGLAARVEGEG